MTFSLLQLMFNFRKNSNQRAIFIENNFFGFTTNLI
jgi:hypothetical protein